MDIADPVVQRIPIILNKSATGKLLLFEYKRMPVSVNNRDKMKVVKARMKPKQQKVEIHLEIDKHSRNFNPELAKNLAPKFNPKNPGDYGSSMVESQVLASATAIGRNNDRYAVGVMHHTEGGQREIHLNPLHGMVYLKQSYSYLDASDRKTEQDKKQSEGTASADTTAKPVSVKFARQDQNRMKKAQSKNLAAQQRLKDEEPWCDTEYFPIQSHESKRERDRLVSEEQDMNAAAILVDPAETFLPVLCPNQLAETIASESAPSFGPLSHDDMSKLSFQEQIVERMKQVSVIRFSKLKKYLDPPRSDAEVLNALQRTAVLVKGNWVVASEQLYKESYVSSSGVTAERLCRCRDHILSLFSKQAIVKQTDISEATKLPANDVTCILREVAVQLKSVGWRFKMEEDTEFLQQYPEEVSRVTTKFEMKVQNVERRAAEERGPSTPTKKAKGPPRQRKTSTKSRKDSYSSDH